MKFTTPFIVIAVSIGMYLVYISPTMTNVKLLNLKKSSQNNLLLKTKELAAKRDAILIDYNNISSSDISRLNKIIPDTFNPVLFINDVNGMVFRYGMVIKEFKVNESKTEAYRTNVVTLRLQGQYSQFMKFLNDLELGSRLVDIVNLSIKPVGGQDSISGFLDYLLEINTYSLR